MYSSVNIFSFWIDEYKVFRFFQLSENAFCQRLG